MNYHRFELSAVSCTGVGIGILGKERFRKAKDFAASDRIRDQLRQAGVEIMDRERIWVAAGGRKGPIPNEGPAQGSGGGGGMGALPDFGMRSVKIRPPLA